jgi:urease accessory protein UreF
MTQQTQLTPATAELLGDIQPLIEQLGSPEGLAALAGGMSTPPRQIASIEDLRSFLNNYHAKILRPLELPAIQRAFHHAGRNELRELVAYDRELDGEALLKNFATASRRAGQAQLQRLRPLRDQRMLKRYLAAVESGDANGWHTLVYGLTLAVYSLPLRQGLLGYAHQTTRGFIQAAGRSLSLPPADRGALLDELCGDCPAVVEQLIAKSALVNG